MRSLYWVNSRGKMVTMVMGIRLACRNCKYKKDHDRAKAWSNKIMKNLKQWD